jgi:two-component system CheB/CheR fusion protein
MGDHHLSVLIVDDLQDTADSLAMLVELWSFTARVAYDGPTGIEAALSFLPDVIIMDIAMPGMTGWKVAQRLRELPGFEDTLLLAISGFSAPGDIARSLEVGFHRHLVKPFDLVEVERLLRSKDRTLVGVGLLAEA